MKRILLSWTFFYCTSILKKTLGPHPFVKIFTRDYDVGGLINNFYGSSIWPISQKTQQTCTHAYKKIPLNMTPLTTREDVSNITVVL